MSAQVVYEGTSAPPAINAAVQGSLEEYNKMKMQIADPHDLIRHMRDFISGDLLKSKGYHIDLSMPSPDGDDTSLPFSYPRLPEMADRSVVVPIFTDFKRHRMGEALADPAPQLVDRKGIDPVPADEFMTRPLWGVADTGPWLHDGRALSLRDAIKMHDSAGSEAHAAVERFNKELSTSEQEALVDFLLTLRLPLDPRYAGDLR